MNPSTRRGHGTSAPSAGLEDPQPVSVDPAERIAELEERLGRLERRFTLRDRGRSMVEHVVPPEASHHFRQAGREQLLGMRAIVDFWIDRIDRREARASAGADQPERIEIE